MTRWSPKLLPQRYIVRLNVLWKTRYQENTHLSKCVVFASDPRFSAPLCLRQPPDWKSSTCNWRNGLFNTLEMGRMSI